MSLEEHNNYRFCFSLALMLFAEILIQDGNFLIRNIFGIADTSSITFIYYLIVFSYVVFCVLKTRSRRLLLNSSFIYLTVVLVYGFSYWLFDNTRQYYDYKTLIVIAFYLPLSIYLVNNIVDFNIFFKVVRPFTYVSIIVSLVIVLFYDYRQFGNYMEFSYAFLPFAFFAYYELRRNLSIANVLASISSLFILFVYGSRATVLFFLVFIILYELFFHYEYKDIKRTVVLIIAAAILLLMSIYWGIVQNYLLQFAETYDSRFLNKLLNNEFFLSNERVSLSIRAREAIMQMGFHVYGIYGDRQFLDGVYSHNIIYESLLSFGWVIGMGVLTYILRNGLVILFKNRNKHIKLLYVLFFFCLFAKFFVSDSFMQNGNFFVFIAITNALLKQSEKISNEVE